MAEFTGERVIPGQSGVDLWNEHLARYAFAARRAAGRRALDAGCGAGYGAAVLAETARSVVALDVAPEAVGYARLNYARPNISFLQASATALPLPGGAFDLVVAFELIEHLEDWAGLLAELRRVLAAGGECLISTPNRAYYAEARRQRGPNPYHFREFDWEELAAALGRFFPSVSLYAENHLAGIAILPLEPAAVAEAALEEPRPDPAEAHFLLAVCTLEEQARPPGLIWAPRAANVLWERERHIGALEGELEEVRREKQELLEMFRSQTAELERSNRWATTLDEQLAAARQRIAALQQELAAQQEAARQAVAGYEAKVAELEQELARRADWALQTERRLGEQLAALRADLETRAAELARCVRLLDEAEAAVVERTLWAQRLDAQLRELENRLGAVRASRWMRLGRLLGLGPRLGEQA